MFTVLRKRGYSRPFLRRLRNFLSSRGEVQGTTVPLISTYSSGNFMLNRLCKNNFQGFCRSFAHVLPPQLRVISAYRRNRNLKDFLVRAKLPPLTPQKPQMLQKQFSTRMFVKNEKDNRVFKLKQRFCPRTVNCVYLIYCSKCGAKYVGETRNSLSVRMTQHRYNIQNRKEMHTLLVSHFVHHGLQFLKVAGLQSNEFWSDRDRKKVERHWIRQLATKTPWGLNLA